MKRLPTRSYRWFAKPMFALLLALVSPSGARAEQLNCSLIIDSLESNITLSLKTAESLLNDLGTGSDQESTLVGESLPQILTHYMNLANLASARMSLVIDDLNAMNQIGAACIQGGHFNAVIGQARSANNICIKNSRARVQNNWFS